MKAVICTKYGKPDVLRIQEISKPVPKDNEVLIKIHASTAASGDCRIRGLNAPFLLQIPMRLIFGLLKPRNPVLGTELSGEITDVGKEVNKFKKGDKVFAMTGMKFGAYAEYICIPENGVLALKPENITYLEASAVAFGGTAALHYLRKSNIKKDDKVLIYGASGSVGSSSVQIAKAFGAEVTGVCSSTNLEMVKYLGANKVLDYTKENFIQKLESYDIIFDAVGKISKSDFKKFLLRHGKFLSVSKGIAKELPDDLIILKKLIEEEKLKAVIDRCYPFEKIAEAHEYVDQGHKKGNVVITYN